MAEKRGKETENEESGIYESKQWERSGSTHLDLEEVLRWGIDLLEGLLTRFWNGLHGDFMCLSLLYNCGFLAGV